MTLSFNILGFEVARVELDIEQPEAPTVTSVVTKGVKKMSLAWVRGMIS